MTLGSTSPLRRRVLLGLATSTVLALSWASGAGASPLEWHSYRVQGAPTFAAVRCPSNEICVALTRGGNIFTTRDASAETPTWKRTADLIVDGMEEGSEQTTAYNLSCPSVHLCVTTLFATIFSTTDPTGSASDWDAVDIQPAFLNAEGNIDSVSCPSVTLCVGGMNASSSGGSSLNIATSANPTGPASTWRIAASPAKADYMTELACSPGGLCAGGDEGSGVIATAHVATGASGWSLVASLPEPLHYIACPSVSLCVGALDNGSLAYSAAPVTNGSWRTGSLTSGRYVTTVSCPGTGFCGATGGDKAHPTAVLTSTHPGQTAGWTFTSFAARGDRLTGISCPSSAFCVAVGDGGLVLVHRRG